MLQKSEYLSQDLRTYGDMTCDWLLERREERSEIGH